MEQNYTIKYPEGYVEDNYYQFEIEAKGYLQDVILSFLDKNYKLIFYDPIRLEQDIQEDLKIHRCFFESNLIVVESVSMEHIKNAIVDIVENNEVVHLLPLEKAPYPT